MVTSIAPTLAPGPMGWVGTAWVGQQALIRNRTSETAAAELAKSMRVSSVQRRWFGMHSAYTTAPSSGVSESDCPAGSTGQHRAPASMNRSTGLSMLPLTMAAAAQMAIMLNREVHAAFGQHMYLQAAGHGRTSMQCFSIVSATHESRNSKIYPLSSETRIHSSGRNKEAHRHKVCPHLHFGHSYEARVV